MIDYYKNRTRHQNVLCAVSVMLWLIFVSYSSFSQPITIDLGMKENDVRIVQDDMQNLRAFFSYNSLIASENETRKGSFCELSIPGAFSTGELGFPKLPATKKLIEIPFGAEVSVNVLNYTITEYKLTDYGISQKIMPVQPSVRKDQDIDSVPFEYKPDIYENNFFLEHEIASIEILGVLRGYRIARLTVSPVSYNPEKNTIRVFNDIELKINYLNADVALTNYIKASAFSPWFEPLRNVLFNNPNGGYTANDDLTKYPVKYLIVSDRRFENDLQPFIEWKTRKGFKMIVAYTDEIGSGNTAIKTWIHNQYHAATPDDPAPSFLLLVGDTPLIPSAVGSSTGKMTDLYYASVDGDYFPEMYYGRFSANNSAQLLSQIEKTLYYEQYQFAEPSFLDKATLIAGSDAIWNPAIAQPTIGYATANYYSTNQGYSEVFSYLSNPYNGCYDSEKVAVGFINYTAHCNQVSWSSPALNQTMVNNFANQGQYPLAIANCCLAADFGYSECIGETWVRAPGKGAVVYIGSAPNSYWFEDFYWSVGAFPIQGNNGGYIPSFAETSLGAYDAPFVSDYVSAGGLVFSGNLAVTEAQLQGYPTHSSAQYYWQAYNVLGDPSIVIYHTQGKINTVNHLDFLPMGFNTFKVQAEPGSYIAISKDDILFGVALVDSTGVTQVSMQPVISSGMFDVVVTKPQHIPYQVQIPAAMVEGPHILLEGKGINDIDGNNNGLADYGENINIHITLKNVGNTTSAELTLTLGGSDEYVLLTSNPIKTVGQIASGENQLIENLFKFSIASFVPDQHIAEFQLQISGGNHTWIHSLCFPIQSPVLSFSNDFEIDDTSGGNGNGIFEPGETAQIVLNISNDGHSDISSVEIKVNTNDSLIQVQNELIFIEQLSAGEITQVNFTVATDVSTPIGYQAYFNILANGGQDGLYMTSRIVFLTIGQMTEYNMTNGIVNTCSGLFYDSGGSNGNYGNSEEKIMTFFPFTADALLRVSFLEFTTENGFDQLYVYNGKNTSAQEFQGSPFSGASGPGTITAMNIDGAITFRFVSDVAGSFSGWKAEISCFVPSTLPDCAHNFFPPHESTDVELNTQLSWESDDALSFDMYFGTSINPPFVATVNNPDYLPALIPNTTYFWKIVPHNIAGYASDCPTWSFTTGNSIFLMTDNSVLVNDGMFYDSGGPINNYGSNEDLTITFLPFAEGYQLEFTFLNFEIETNNGLLYIFDGPDINAPLFPGSPFQGIITPGTIFSSHSSGAITFRFTSGEADTKPGWAAAFRCKGPLAAFPSASSFTLCEGNSVQLYANATGGTGSYTFLWEPAIGLSNPTAANPVAKPGITTTYTVAVNDGENIAVGSNTIILNALPEFSIGNDTILCANFALVLDATIPDGISYFWTPGGETTPEIIADSSGVGLGKRTYSVTVVDINGCVSQASITIVFDACTFAGNENHELSIMVYPNPAASLLNINVKGLYDELSFFLLNHHGQIVYSQYHGKLTGSMTEQINTNQFARGIYYLRFLTRNSVYTKKVILY